MLKSICNYIQSNDRNSDIMNAYQEYLNGELGKDAMFEMVTRILTEWKEDLEYTGMTKREEEYYKYLGL